MPRSRSVRRSLASRCFGTLLALWFAISIAEPQWLHSCPMHNAPARGDAPAAAHGGHVAHSPAGLAHDGAATTGHHVAVPADADAPAPGHTGAHCLCLGDCAPGGVVTLASVPDVPVARVVVVEARGALARADYVPVVRERTLPFATAPPAL